jgi:hypothetical protein
MIDILLALRREHLVFKPRNFFCGPFWLSWIRIFGLNSFPDPGSPRMLEMTDGVVEQRGVRRAAGEGAGHTQQEPQPAAHVLHRLVTVLVGSYSKFMPFYI